MPKLIPTTTRIGIINNGTTRGSDEEETGSNDEINEDPMNLVETSWDLSSLNDNAGATAVAKQCQ